MGLMLGCRGSFLVDFFGFLIRILQNSYSAININDRNIKLKHQIRNKHCVLDLFRISCFEFIFKLVLRILNLF